MLSRVFTAFESRDFRLMWTGACTSSIGTWMQKLAQAWLVFDISRSPFMLGLDNFLAEAPIFVFALYAGVVADRTDRRVLLVWSQFVQMACALILAALIGFGYREVWYILVLSFVVGTAQSFGAPAYQSLLPSLVPREHLPNAIAMNSIQFNVARLIGPAIGGFTLSALGAAWCFGLNGISFLAVIATLYMIHPRYNPAPTTESVMDSMKGGLRFIRERTGMTALMGVSFLATFLGIPLTVFLPVFAKDVYGGDETTYTWLLIVQAAGAVCGALLVAIRGKGTHLGRDIVISVIGLGILVCAFALTPSMLLAIVFLFFASLALIACFSMLSSLVQFIATDEVRGRVMSIYNIAFRGGMPISSLVMGHFVSSYSAPTVVAANGVILVALGLYLALAHREIRTL